MLSLTCRVKSPVPIEIEGLTPDWACGKPLAEIERFEVFHGNRKIPLAEVFDVSGDAADSQFEFDGDLSGVHWIGAHMSTGRIYLRGSAGRHVGSQMRGGEIHVSGDVDGWAGAEMRGGLVQVHGNAGHLLGAAYRGSSRGMTGGTILVDGNVGNETGHSLRRGLIAIGGSAADLVGFNMIAGAILIFGDCGIRAGAGMRRGTIGLFGRADVPLLPTFRYATTYQPQILRVMLRDLQRRGLPFDSSLLDSEFDVHHGDLVTVGRGEILRPHFVEAKRGISASSTNSDSASVFPGNQATAATNRG